MRWGGSRPPALRSAWRPCARSLWALAGGAALTSSTDTPIPRARGGGRAGSAGRTYGRTGTEGRAHRQAMPGEAARAELLLPEAGGPGPRTGEAPRFPPREASPPLRPAWSPLRPLPVFSRLALRCTGMLPPAPCPLPAGKGGCSRVDGPGGPASAQGSVHPYCLHRSCGPVCTPARGDTCLMPEGRSGPRPVLERGAGRVLAPVGVGARRPWGSRRDVQAHLPGEARPAMVEAEGSCLSLGRPEGRSGWPSRSALCGCGRAKGTLLSPGDGTSAGSNKGSRAGVSRCRVWGSPCSDCLMTLNESLKPLTFRLPFHSGLCPCPRVQCRWAR